MFQLTEISNAHSKVKSGADFPGYIQELKELGVTKYETYVRDGHTVFFGKDNYKIKSEPGYSKLRVANICDKERFRHYLRNHQRGQTDYPAFCNNAAETGVKKWIGDISNMTCTYYDKLNTIMLEEKIQGM